MDENKCTGCPKLPLTSIPTQPVVFDPKMTRDFNDVAGGHFFLQVENISLYNISKHSWFKSLFGTPPSGVNQITILTTHQKAGQFSPLN